MSEKGPPNRKRIVGLDEISTPIYSTNAWETLAQKLYERYRRELLEHANCTIEASWDLLEAAEQQAWIAVARQSQCAE